MRIVRLLVAASLAAGVACAPRSEIVVSPVFAPGSSLRFRFATAVETTLEQQAESGTVRSTLTGTIEVQVIDTSPEGSRLRIRVEPTTSSRDGEPTSPGPSQTREVLLTPDGTIAGGQPGSVTDAELDEATLATLLVPAVPAGPLSVGQTWTLGDTSGRLSELDRDDGRDIAGFALERRRPLTIERILDGRSVELSGFERAETRLRWDLDGSRPVAASIRSHARFDVRAGSSHGGSLTIDAETTVGGD